MQGLWAFTGPDGSGKGHWTALLSQWAGAAALPCTQYHHAAECANPGLSEAVDDWGKACDRNNLTDQKALTLILKMQLFEQELKHRYTLGYAAVVAERHPVVDTYVYGRLYGHHLGGNRPAALTSRWPGHWSETLCAQAEAALRQLQTRAGTRDLNAWVTETVKRPVAEAFSALAAFYAVPLPEVLLWPRGTADALVQRLNDRGTAGATEIHEQREALERLLAIYEEIWPSLAAALPGTRLFAFANETELRDIYEQHHV
jgi:thymidylate kinase